MRERRAGLSRHVEGSSSSDLQQLVGQAQSGDVDAWETIYRDVYSRLYAYGRALLLAEHLIDDVISETMSRALRKLENFRPRGSGFDAWIFGIFRNVARETNRSFARHEPLDESVISNENGPLASVIAKNEQNDVTTSFSRLNEGEREILALRSIAGLSASAVGEVLGLTEGAVRTAQSRALKNLRTIFQEVNGGE